MIYDGDEHPTTITDIEEHFHPTRNNGYVFHNTKFDIRALSTIGIEWSDEQWHMTDDTLIASHIYNSNESHRLKDLSLKYLRLLDDDEKQLRDDVIKARTYGRQLGFNIAVECHPHFPGTKRFTKNSEAWKFDMWLPSAAYELLNHDVPERWKTQPQTYGDRDVERTILLWLLLKDELIEEGLYHIYEERIHDLKTSFIMEQNGVSLRPILNTKLESYKSKAATFRDVCEQSSPVPGFVVQGTGSAKLLKQSLYGQKKNTITPILNSSTTFDLPIIEKTKTGEPSTSLSTLISLLPYAENNTRCKQFLTNLILWKKTNKAIEYLSSYDAYAMTYNWGKYLHPSLNMTGTHTTRFSSNAPNQQNVGNPEDGSAYNQEAELSRMLAEVGINLREVYGPTEGRVWFGMDYKSLQLRIFAYTSGEQSLIDAFDRGEDPHDYLARRIFNISEDNKPTKDQRRIGKNVNFGFIFGAAPKTIENTAGQPGLWNTLKKIFPSAHKFIESTSIQVKRVGYVCLYNSDNKTLCYRLNVPRQDPHKGVNYIVQGYEGIIVKRAMYQCQQYLEKIAHTYEYPPYMTMQVHDEIVFDAPTNRTKQLPYHLKNLMESAGQTVGMETPVDVDLITTSWDKGEKL